MKTLKKEIVFKTKSENLYDRIKRIMKIKNITRKELSENINVSYNTLTTMFQRESMNVDINTIKKIADYIGVTIEFLVSGEDIDFSQYDHIKAFPPYTISINLETIAITATLQPHQAHIVYDLVKSYMFDNVENKTKK